MYVRARTLDEAVQALETPDVQILAGGTDFYPAHVGRRSPVPVLDITGIGEIAGIATRPTMCASAAARPGAS